MNYQRVSVEQKCNLGAIEETSYIDIYKDIGELITSIHNQAIQARWERILNGLHCRDRVRFLSVWVSDTHRHAGGIKMLCQRLQRFQGHRERQKGLLLSQPQSL